VIIDFRELHVMCWKSSLLLSLPKVSYIHSFYFHFPSFLLLKIVIAPYLEELVPSLLKLLRSDRAALQEISIAALGSVAMGAEDRFEEFAVVRETYFSHS